MVYLFSYYTDYLDKVSLGIKLIAIPIRIVAIKASAGWLKKNPNNIKKYLIR
tara:strand:+ start:905 stop:1060 length:156 start_codon:yes stop_codon:yes gene_type:complete